jgi:hypothetical protein
MMNEKAGTAGAFEIAEAPKVQPPVPVWAMVAATALCGILTIPIPWNVRDLISADGRAYVEVATNAVQRGPQYLFSNGYWSPGYPALLAIVFKLLHPSIDWQLAIVHSFDWLLCLAAYACFTWFLMNLLRWLQDAHSGLPGGRGGIFALLVFAYSFLFVSHFDTTLWLVGPTVVMEGLVYLAAALCLRLSLPDSRLVHHIALGAVLAIGYAVKAPLFPLSLVLFAILLVWPVDRRFGRKGTAVAMLSFLIISSPVVAALSYSKGRITFGDSGSLNYAWYVNGVSRDAIWDGQLPRGTLLVHRPRMLLNDPPIVKFESEVDSAYPYWYDPSWWYDGVHGHFNLRQQIRQYLRCFGIVPKVSIGGGGSTVFQLGKRWLVPFLGLLGFVVAGLRVRTVYAVLRRNPWLILWPACAAAAFASVLLEYRYLVPFVVMVWTVLFAIAWKAIKTSVSTRIMLTVAAGLLLIFCPKLGREIVETQRQPASSGNRAVTEQLTALGLRRGDELATVSWPFVAYEGWLLGARFDIEVLAKDPEALSRLPEPEVAGILQTLRANGAKAVFSEWRPAFRNDSGWIRLNDKRVFVRLLQ